MGNLKALWYPVLLGLLAGITSDVSAQEYLLEKGDLLNVSFWQQPELNTQVRIDVEGKIDLPLVGRISAAGLTIDELSREIVDKISVYNKRITQASVSIEEYSSRSIYITGAVNNPGKFPFVNPPNIWEAILGAGGPLPTAQLDKIQLIRAKGEESKITEYDLTQNFGTGELQNLPILKPGDNIHVPNAAPLAQPQMPGQAARPFIGQGDVVYVFGQVVTPGVYPLEEGMDVLQAIILAGGPLIAANDGRRLESIPDLGNVKVITKGPQAPVVYSVDLENYTREATPLPLLLKPGDTVFIPARQNYGRFVLTNALVEVLRSSVAIVTSYLLLNELFGANNN